jgi:Protein of unknown function (DUF1761)
MSFDVLSDLNWLAVLVAALAYFVLGGIWYAPPVFGKAWMAAAGYAEPADGEGPGSAIYIAPLIGDIIAAIAVGMLAAASGSDTMSEGIVLGLVTGIGVAGVVVGTTAVFESNKPSASRWGWITGLYHALGFVLMAVIVSVWQ